LAGHLFGLVNKRGELFREKRKAFRPKTRTRLKGRGRCLPVRKGITPVDRNNLYILVER